MYFRALTLSGILCLLSIASTGCSGAQKIDVQAPASALAASTNMHAADFLQSRASSLPEDVVAVLAVDLDRAIEAGLLRGMGLMPSTWDNAPMREDLAALSRRRIGFDATRARRALVFVTERQTAGILIEGDFARPQGAQPDAAQVTISEVAEAPLLLIDLDDPGLVGLAIDPIHAEDFAQIKSGALATLKDTPRLEVMTALLRKAGPGYLTLAMRPEGNIKMGIQIATGVNLEAGAISLGDGLTAVIQSDPESLKSIEARVNTELGNVLSMLEKEMTSINTQPLAEGSALILAYHLFKGLKAEITPRIEGDLITVQASWARDASWAPAAVALSAVAIPAFIKYTKQAKASEARMNLKTIADGLMAHYETEFADRSGQLLEPSFPPSVGPTPALSCCSDASHKCLADPKVWDHPTWQAIKFSITRDHYYTYEIVNEREDDKTSTVTAIARGDLDCDEALSIFMIEITANKITREVQATPIFLVEPDNELE